MVIQEKLNFLVENKDTEEVKYPHVYKLFHDLENYQENEVFDIWMEKIAEPISVRIDYIKEYCDEEEKKEKGKRGKCDLMIALFTVYKKLKEKPYLCHCNTDSCFIKNNPFNNKPILEYEYYNYTSLHSLFWGYRSFPPDTNLDEENKRYKACLKQMFEVLDSSSNSFNSLNAIRNGFYDFDYTPVKEIQKSDLDCAYLERFISSIADKRRKNDIIVIEEKKDSIIDEHEEIYKEIQKKLNKYISFDGVEKYKAIINYKINNKSFNNIDGRSYFVMKSNTKRDICKFAQCFNITLKEAEKIFKNIEKKNINLNTKDSVTINMTDPNDFEKALIEVRNEFLHKINPEKFKLL